MSQTGTTNGQVTLTADPAFGALRDILGSTASPAKIGRALMDAMETHHLSQQALAKRLGKTAGSVHHYIAISRDLSPALRNLAFKNSRRGHPRGRKGLPFKTVRVLASVKGWDRQAELAAPFLSRQMSSMDAETFIVFAKQHPGMRLEALIATYATRNAQAEVEETIIPPQESYPQPSKMEPAQLQRDLLKLAGEVVLFQLQEPPEIDLMPVRSAYRLLVQRGKWLT